MFWLERRALREGLINVDAARAGIDDSKVELIAQVEEKTLRQKVVQTLEEVDLVGLILLGFGWSLVSTFLPILTGDRVLQLTSLFQLLLPFSLYGGAKGGFHNQSLIAMIAVGAVCLLAYPVYEWKFAKYPSMPKRILYNRSFNTAVLINVVYFIVSWVKPNRHLRTHELTTLCFSPQAAYLQVLYLSSYVYIVTDITPRNWNCKFDGNRSCVSTRF
jgi:hypothetical protein